MPKNLDTIAAPDGWRVEKLGEICKLGGGSIQTGPFGSQLHAEDYKEEGTPIITVEHLGDNEILHSNLPLVGDADYKRLQKYSLQVGDLVFSRVGAIDRCAYVSGNENGWLFSGRCLRVRPGKNFSAKFLSYQLNSLPCRRWILNNSVGSTMACLNTSILSNLPVLIPTLDEQERIAAILDEVDETIAHTSTLIAKLKQMKAGLLHDLLTRGLDENGKLRDAIAHPEQFKDSPLGQIPKNWNVHSLEDCVHSQITYGIVQAGSHIENGVPYIRTGDMAGDNLTPDELLRTSRQIAVMYQRSTVRTGEIVCAIRATVGKVLEVPPELDGANLTQGTARIAPRQEINNRFLLWSLRSNAVKKQIALVVKGTTFAEITLEALRKIKVAIPSKREEQDRIAAILEAHEKQVNAEEAYLSKLKEQKKGLMHDLLTGRVRVTDLKEIST